MTRIIFLILKTMNLRLREGKRPAQRQKAKLSSGPSNPGCLNPKPKLFLQSLAALHPLTHAACPGHLLCAQRCAEAFWATVQQCSHGTYKVSMVLLPLTEKDADLQRVCDLLKVTQLRHDIGSVWMNSPCSYFTTCFQAQY